MGRKSVDAGMEVWIVSVLDSMVGSGVEILKFVPEDKKLMLSNLFLPRTNFQALVDRWWVLHQVDNG